MKALPEQLVFLPTDVQFSIYLSIHMKNSILERELIRIWDGFLRAFEKQ